MDTRPMKDNAVERKALAWMDDPYKAVSYSNTQMHSVPREEQEAVQIAGFNYRLEQRRSQIPTLAKLADAQGIKQATCIEDMAPVLFTHDIYKSYPISLLAKSRFDQLTKWLSRLTPTDISHAKVDKCGSIDEWLDALRDQTPLDVATSSGTSGTLSFFPKTKKDYMISATGVRVGLTQRFGDNSPGDMDSPIHVLTPFYRDGYSTVSRLPQYYLDIFCKGDQAKLHTALPYKASADLIWLAARLRAAQKKGDASRIDVPETLLARRSEWEKMVKESPALQADFIRKKLPELKGQRVFALGITVMFYDIAKAGLEAGIHGEFAPNSVIMAGGGGKGIVLPDNVFDIIGEFFGVKNVFGAYGMTEQNAWFSTCDAGRLHMPPWLTVLLLDPETGKPLPRTGTQTGRASFFDMTLDGPWGGIISGDRITVDYSPCKCGRTTLHIDKQVDRYSELAGGDDKITCAATPSAQQDALDFLTTL